MPAQRKAFVRRRLGRAAIVRRIPEAIREITYPALLKAGKEMRDDYRRHLRSKHYITGRAYRSVKMRRSKRLMLVRVGTYKDPAGKYSEHRIRKGKRVEIRAAQKIVWLEFGTKQGQRAEDRFLPMFRKVSNEVPAFVRQEWNKHADLVFARFLRSEVTAAARRGIRL